MKKPTAFRRDAAAEALRDAMAAPDESAAALPSPDAQSAAKAPLRTLRIPPSGFAQAYANRPTTPAPVGLVLVSEQVMSRAQAEALREAWETHPQQGEDQLRIDVFNTALMVNVLCRAVTEPHDATRLYFPDVPEVQIRSAFTVETMRRLWEAYARMATEESPLSREATDDDIATLADALRAGAVAAMPEATQRRIRRVLGELCSELL